MPKEADFVMIPAGKSWTWNVSLASVEAGVKTVLLFQKPGLYQLKCTYLNPKQSTDPLAGGSWIGTLTSNEVALKVKPADAK